MNIWLPFAVSKITFRCIRSNNLISLTNNKLQDDGVSRGLVSSVEGQSDVKTLPPPYNQVRVLVFVSVVSATILFLV